MDQKFITPVRIYINDKFVFTAQEAWITQEKPEEDGGITPHDWSGTVIRIRKELPRSNEEKKKSKTEEKNQEKYDHFFRRFVDAIDEPGAHTPVDLDNI